MTYFKDFPYTTYTLNGKTEVVTDILRRSSFFDPVKNNVAVYREYYVIEGDTPESLANEFYGSVNLYWIILLFNSMHDPNFEWPLDQQELNTYCENLYGANGMYKTRYYELNGNIVGEYKEYDYTDENFVWVPPSNPFPDNLLVKRITHFEHEERQNDSKRRIKIPREEFVGEIVKQFKETLQ